MRPGVSVPQEGGLSSWLQSASFFWKLFWQWEVLKPWVRIAGELPGTSNEQKGRSSTSRRFGEIGEKGSLPCCIPLYFLNLSFLTLPGLFLFAEEEKADDQGVQVTRQHKSVPS